MTQVKSWVEISADALRSNIAAIRAASGRADLLAVIKADGYGHGAAAVAPVLAEAGVRWLGVTDADEGARVRRALGSRVTRLLIMVGMEASDADMIVAHGLTPAIWTAEQVEALQAAADRASGQVEVHVEIDTGMARQGATPGTKLATPLLALRSARRVRCEALMTHFAESEVSGSEITRLQRRRFEAALIQARDAGVVPTLLHAANTSAVDEASTRPWLEALANGIGAGTMVRTGYAVYGHCLPVENGTGILARDLRAALSWKTRILDLREIGAGDTVGYGATFTAPHAIRLALLPVGYADGFRRAASSGKGDGWVMIHGHRAPVVGRVSMNLTTVDITGIDGVTVGDEAALLGEGVTAEDHARWAGTLGYDILCGIRARHVVV